MKSVKTLLFILAIMGVSGFELEQEKDLFSSKTRAFERCEEWKDEGRVLIYETKINIAEEASRFGIEHPEPHSLLYENDKDKLNAANARYEWNKARMDFAASNPSKKIKVSSRLYKYVPKQRLFEGYENKLIQDGSWKDEEGMRGKMQKAKQFHY